MDLLQYVQQNYQQILTLLVEHIKLTAISVGLAIAIGVPAGVLISYLKKLNKPVLGLANVVQAIPSMALLGFMIPFLGIGTVPAVVTVILYSLLPIIKNTFTGIDNINPQTVEAARGIGLTKLQVLFKVQIPLALPVIMAGMRISAVTAVGLMTMAAFIGAGGLGFLVFSGIRTVNNAQILAGAIPACLLALGVDAIASLIERWVTPASLQKKGSSVKSKKKRITRRVILAATALVIIFAFVFTWQNSRILNDKVIRVGSKDYTEQFVLSYMVSDLIEEKTDISVDRKVNLGGTQVCFSALTKGDIDLYIDYSGTVYSDTLGHPPISDPQMTYDRAKEELKATYGIESLQQMRFNNTYTLAVLPEMQQEYQLKTISDLAEIGETLRSGTTFEFLNREDGLPGLLKTYGFNMKKSVALDGSARYLALQNDEVDVIDAFATDGLLKKFDLYTLEDDKNFFPPYYAMPLIRGETAEKYPEVIPLIEQLGELLTDEIMMELNFKVDELQMQPDVVAKDFLKSNGLISQ